MPPKIKKSVAEKFHFTPRQVEVCDAIFLGMSRKGIADALKISIKTVDHHLQKIYKKTSSPSMATLIIAILDGR